MISLSQACATIGSVGAVKETRLWAGMWPVRRMVSPIRIWAARSPSLCVSLTVPRMAVRGATTMKIRSAALGALFFCTRTILRRAGISANENQVCASGPKARKPFVTIALTQV